MSLTDACHGLWVVLGQGEKNPGKTYCLGEGKWNREKVHGKEITIFFIGLSGTKLSKNAFLNVFAHQPG